MPVAILTCRKSTDATVGATPSAGTVPPRWWACARTMFARGVWESCALITICVSGKPWSAMVPTTHIGSAVNSARRLRTACAGCPLRWPWLLATAAMSSWTRTVVSSAVRSRRAKGKSRASPRSNILIGPGPWESSCCSIAFGIGCPAPTRAHAARACIPASECVAKSFKLAANVASIDGVWPVGLLALVSAPIRSGSQVRTSTASSHDVDRCLTRAPVTSRANGSPPRRAFIWHMAGSSLAGMSLR